MVSDTSLVVEAVSASELSRDETWWAIYAQVFPSREREPRDVIVRSLERSVGIALRARRGATTIGLATAHLLKTMPAVFLVYVGTAPSARGVGAGHALVEHAWQLGVAELQAKNLQPMGMIWEIEDSKAERAHFFRRLGGELLARPYMQPPVDGVAAVPMRLMYRPSPGSQLPTEPAIDALVRAIYFEKYGDLNGIPVSVLSDLLRSSDSGNAAQF